MTSGFPGAVVVGVTRDRIAAVSPAARSLHMAVLRGFAATARPPDPAAVGAATPPGHDLAGLLRELHERDVVRLDGDGRIRVAYPFSGAPTPHLVAIDGGPSVYAMCTIDALGICAMLGRDTVVTSTDPVSAEPVQVTLD